MYTTPYTNNAGFYNTQVASAGIYQPQAVPVIYKPRHTPVQAVLGERGVQYAAPSFTYKPTVGHDYKAPKTPYHRAQNSFLKLYRPQTQFINSAREIEGYVKEAFEKTTGKQLPLDIIVQVLERDDMKRVHEANGGRWNDNIQGFSLNTKPLRQVFVKQADLDAVMLVVGHELGHVLTPSLENHQDEEAKAFAFEFAWMQTIVQHNIANLKDNINLNFVPATNGIHDVAFRFIKNKVRKGANALQTYYDIAKKMMCIAG